MGGWIGMIVRAQLMWPQLIEKSFIDSKTLEDGSKEDKSSSGLDRGRGRCFTRLEKESLISDDCQRSW